MEVKGKMRGLGVARLLVLGVAMRKRQLRFPMQADTKHTRRDKSLVSSLASFDGGSSLQVIIGAFVSFKH